MLIRTFFSLDPSYFRFHLQLCIEPNPIYWSSLSYRKCHVASAVVGRSRMEEVDYRFDNGAYGGISSARFDNKGKANASTEKRFTVPLQEILERAHAPSMIDYLSLDVEGAEEYIMSSFPFHKFHFKVLTIERPNANLRHLLAQHHYTFLGKIHPIGETLWVHSNYTDEIDTAALRTMCSQCLRANDERTNERTNK